MGQWEGGGDGGGDGGRDRVIAKANHSSLV